MSMPLKWEFPGGKIEPMERAEECIIREIKEELDAEISVVSSLPSSVHDYGEKTVELIPFVCTLISDGVKCREHNKLLWDNPYNLSSLDWAEADVPVYNEYLRYLEAKA